MPHKTRMAEALRALGRLPDDAAMGAIWDTRYQPRRLVPALTVADVRAQLWQGEIDPADVVRNVRIVEWARADF